MIDFDTIKVGQTIYSSSSWNKSSFSWTLLENGEWLGEDGARYSGDNKKHHQAKYYFYTRDESDLDSYKRTMKKYDDKIDELNSKVLIEEKRRNKFVKKFEHLKEKYPEKFI